MPEPPASWDIVGLTPGHTLSHAEPNSCARYATRYRSQSAALDSHDAVTAQHPPAHIRRGERRPPGRRSRPVGSRISEWVAARVRAVRERSEALGTLVDMRRVRLNYSLCRLGKLGQAATVTDDWNSVDVVLLECIARRAEEEPT